MRRFAVILLMVQAVFAQFVTTPYDLIRPTWPEKWDSTVFNSFTPGARSTSVPSIRTPFDYLANEVIPDTLDQAYLDAMNVKISPIRVNQAGYRPQDEKLIYYVGSATNFDVIDLTGKVVGSGTFSATGSSTESSWKIIAGVNAERNMNIRYTTTATGPTGSLQKGLLPAGLPENQRLRVKVGTEVSADFVISDKLYSMVRDAALKYFGIARSGNSESWFHPASHTKDGGGKVVGGTGISPSQGALAGGWYDCGDHLKESQTQAYAFMALAVMAAANPDKDEDNYAYNQGLTNKDGIPDMLREAKHGADFALAAYDLAGGVIDNMALSVGNFGADHGWWSRPEFQDLIPTTVTGRGGPHERDVRLGELGSNISGQFAAGLALVAKHYERFDPTYAAKCLKVSKEMYDFAKKLALGQISPTNNKAASAWSSAAYNGNNEHHDDLGLAAIALLYATQDTMYLYDAVENPAMKGGQTRQDFIGNMGGAGAFRGGWFTVKTATLLKDIKNTSWANAYAFTLYAFYKLILSTQDRANLYGISNARRLEYIENTILTMGANLGDVSNGSASINLPGGVIGWKQYKAGYDPIWFKMNTDQTWIYNRYQAGNIFEVLAYADVGKDLEGVALPNLGVKDWKSKELFQLGVHQMDYMLGLNPWDFSMLLGVGDKNDAHPHHRAANPEGKNVPGGFYKYRPPTGTLYGGVTPTGTNSIVPSSLSWEDYHISETCIDAAATFLAPSMILSRTEDLSRAPEITVEIKYVGFDSAIVVVKQSMRGTSTINYGTSATALNLSSTTPNEGVEHTMVLKPLENGTTYYFTVTSTNAYSGNSGVRYLVDSTQTPYSFTTLASPPEAADIQNVKVCNISADSAEIMWYTPNGEYESKIYWDTLPVSYDNMSNSQSGDISGIPTKFHYMKIGGLKEQTTYYYAVESNGVVRSVNDKGQRLQFTTPVTQYNFEVRTYEYDVGGLQFVNFNIFNKEDRAFDSLEMRLYVNATESQMLRAEGSTLCPTMFDSDICQAYDEAGFNKPCENDNEIRALLRGAAPKKLDDTYDPATGMYAWYVPLPLGSTTIKSLSRLRMDIRFSNGIANKQGDGTWKCDPMVSPAAKKFSAATGDWTWLPHSKVNGDPINYVGMPKEDKEFGDADLAPVNPYLTVYRKGEFVWGYSPSYKEMVTKRADYKLSTKLSAPFNVSNGAYIELDQATSTVFVKGVAEVTEGGVITDIWVNGKKLDNVASAAVYNATTDRYDLNIPVKLGIGANKIDVTIFAGPDLACEPCQENGGCAFVNHNFFIQFSKGNFTASSLMITDVNTGKSVASPALPGQTQFTVTVLDADKSKAKVPTLDALIINARKKDTLKVTLTLSGDKYITSSPISAVAKDASTTSGSEIAFFGGDTILVQYTDPEDEEDISTQAFFAEPTSPSLVSATARDANCDGVMDVLDLVFSQAFDVGDKVDSLWVSVKDPITQASDSFFVVNGTSIAGISSFSVDLPARTSIPRTGAPSGKVTAYIVPNGVTFRELSTVSVSDGILPQLIGVSLLENPEPRTSQDTLKISFNEPVVLASRGTWPLAVLNGNSPVSTVGITVVGEATTEDNGRSWLYVVEGNTNGSIIDSGFVTSVLPTFTITDLGSNTLNPNNPCATLVPIIEVPKPVPVELAEMRDRDGDGSPDQLYMEFVRKLRDKDMLDSFVVKWGSPVQLKAFAPDVARQWTLGMKFGSHQQNQLDANGDPVLDADSLPVMMEVADTMSTLELNFKDSTFAYGATQGYLNGKGGVIPRLGPEGGFFDTEYIVNDRVGPVIVSARKGKNLGNLDSLAIAISEPVDTTDSDFILERRRGSEITGVIPMRVVRASDSLYVFLYTSDAVGAVRIGDYVRLTKTTAGVIDKSGNEPGIDNPWVEVKGSLSNTVSYDITMRQSVTGGKTRKEILLGYPIDPPDDGDYFRITVLDPVTGNELKLGEGSGSIITNPTSLYDTTEYKHLGPTFLLTVQLPGALILKSDSNAWNYLIKTNLNIYDNMGQFVNQLKWQIDLDQLGRKYLAPDGSLTFRVEWMVHDQSAPKAQTGRTVGSGAYVGVFQFNSTATALVNDEAKYNEQGAVIAPPSFRKGQIVKGSATKRQSFGVMRVK